MDAFITLIIIVLLISGGVYLVMWGVKFWEVPEPLNRVIVFATIIIGLVFFLQRAMPMLGV